MGYCNAHSQGTFLSYVRNVRINLYLLWLLFLTACLIRQHGRQLLENYRSLVEELTQEDLDHLAHARSCSVSLCLSDTMLQIC